MDEEDEREDGSLIGYWLEGDSLAPPCQAEMDVVDAIIDLLSPPRALVWLILDVVMVVFAFGPLKGLAVLHGGARSSLTWSKNSSVVLPPTA